MAYCAQCSNKMEQTIPDGDVLSRLVCPICGYIAYANPKVIVGCVAYWKNKILLCQRAIEPQKGLWTVPAGFMEINESMAEGASRETSEEACAQVDAKQLKLIGIADVVRAHQVHVFYSGELLAEEFAPGIESLKVRLVTEDEIPWQEIAFPSVAWILRHFLDQPPKAPQTVVATTVFYSFGYLKPD